MTKLVILIIVLLAVLSTPLTLKRLIDQARIKNGPDVFYRTIQPSDNAQLAQLVRVSLKKYGLDIPGTAYYDPNLEHLYEYYTAMPEARNYFVALNAEGAVVGGIGVDRFEQVEGCAELQKLYVAEDWQRHGIGMSLIRMLEQEARRLGYEKIYLETHSNLKEALSLYEKAGYRQIERPEYAVHETMDTFLIKDIT